VGTSGGQRVTVFDTATAFGVTSRPGYNQIVVRAAAGNWRLSGAWPR
jgi:hypothetical protein